MRMIEIEEAGAQLDELVQAALAGEEIIIARENVPLVKLLPFKAPAPERRLGEARDQIRLHEDFDQPLDDFGGYEESLRDEASQPYGPIPASAGSQPAPGVITTPNKPDSILGFLPGSVIFRADIVNPTDGSWEACPEQDATATPVI